jgi:hypothetical protein
MAIATALTRLLEIAHPILLAPMGGGAGGALAAADHLAKTSCPNSVIETPVRPAPFSNY